MRAFDMTPLPRELVRELRGSVAHDVLDSPVLRAFGRTCAANVFAEHGYVLLDLSVLDRPSVETLCIARAIGVALAKPVPIYQCAIDVWSPLRVELAAHPARAHGVGLSPLHVDLLTWERVPRAIALYCLRPDPAGGGATELADLPAALARVSHEVRNALRRPDYSYWRDTGVDLLGEHLDWFAVVPEPTADQPIRYTRKLRDRIESEDGAFRTPSLSMPALEALDAFHAELLHVRTHGVLGAKHLLVFDQHRFAHSRLPLGESQDRIAAHERRLLQQCYLTPYPRALT